MALIGYTEEVDFLAYATARGIALLLPESQTLTLALDYVEMQTYALTKTDSEQALEFPRGGSTVVPAKIIQAQMEVALLYDAGIDILAVIGPKVTGEAVSGAVSVTYSDSVNTNPRYQKIDKLLAEFLGGNGANSFVVGK